MAGIVWLLVMAAVVVIWRRTKARRRHIGSAGAGTVYDWLNEEKRNAVEIIVEEKAAERDEEKAEDDGEKAEGKT